MKKVLVYIAIAAIRTLPVHRMIPLHSKYLINQINPGRMNMPKHVFGLLRSILQCLLAISKPIPVSASEVTLDGNIKLPKVLVLL
jgi:hypothetical protein